MKKFIQIIILTTISLGLTSCDFILDKENFIDIHKTLNPEAIEINFENQDTLQLRLIDTAIYFSINPKKYKILEINYYKNNEHIKKFETSLRYQIPIESYSLDDGLNTYRIEVITNTKSIADLTQNEGYVFNHESYVYKFSNENPQMHLASEVIDGVYKLSWNKYPFPDFKSYSIERKGKILFKTNDIDKLSFVDSTMIEKHDYYEYNLDVTFENDPYDEMFRTILKDEVPLPNIEVEKTGQQSAIISWKKSQFKHAFKKYELTLPGGIIGQDTFKRQAIKNIYDIDSTRILIRNLPFGTYSKFRLCLTPHKWNYDERRDYTTEISIPIGTSCKNKNTADLLFTLNKQKRILGITGNKLQEYNEDTDEFITINRYNKNIDQVVKSANESCIWFSDKDSIYAVDNNFNITQSYSLNKIREKIHRINRNGHIYKAFNTDAKRNIYLKDGGNIVYRYNIDTQTIENSFKVDNTYPPLEISENGEYIIAMWNLYKLINNKYKHIIVEGRGLRLHPTKNLLISYLPSTIDLYDLETFTIKENIPRYGYMILASKDWGKWMLYNKQKDEAYIYSVDERKVIATFKPNFTEASGFSNYSLLFDNYIYYNNLKLKY